MSSGVEIEWDDLRANGFGLLHDSLTRNRLPALEKIRKFLVSGDADLLAAEKETLQKLAILVLRTYNYYQDKKSRSAALAVLQAYVGYDGKYLQVFVSYVHEAATKSSNLAPTDILTLLAWANKFAELEVQAKSTSLWPQIAEAQALLLHSCSEANTSQALHRRRILVSAVANTKKAFESVLTFGLAEDGQNLARLSVELMVKSTIGPSAVLLYLGVLGDALAHMQPEYPSMYETLKTADNLNTDVVDYVANQAILAKVPPCSYALRTFTVSYVGNFISNEQVNAKIIPAIEKAIMRSSESAFTHLTLPFFGTKDIIDLSDVFASSKLFTHILSGIKSTKENVREKAFETLCAAFSNTLPRLLVEDSNKIIDELFKAFKGTSNADSKVYLVKGLKKLAHVDDSVTAKLLSSTLPLTAKEQNEIILTPLVEVLASEYIAVLKSGKPVVSDAECSQITAQFEAGLQNPKLPLRSIWATKLGDILYSEKLSESSKLAEFLAKVYASLLKSLEAAQKSPLLTVTNKGISCAYICIALSNLYQSSIDTKKVFVDSLADSEEKFSILTSPKVISKLSGSEQVWCLRALVASWKHATNHIAYATSYLYFLISSNTLYQTRLEALESLKTLLAVDSAQVSEAFISSIKEIVSLADTLGADGDLHYNLKNLVPVLNYLVQVPDKEVKAKGLVELILVAHHSQIPVKERWIGFVLRASLDPETLVGEYADYILQQLYDNLLKAEPETESYKAACRAITTADFVNPGVIPDKIAKLLKLDIDVNNLSEIDATSLQIWKAPEGEMVVDVLNSKPKKAEDKNTKDYETRKWEESLKKELAQKNKNNKKLTKEEQILVKEQLAKESDIRKSVSECVKKFYRAFYVIRELSGRDSVYIRENDLLWLLVVSIDMIELLKSPLSSEIFGTFGTDIFIGVSNILTARLGYLKESVGVAILRANNIEGVRENFLEQPLLGLLSKVLFRIKILADDYFDILSFAYILPLITRMLDTGKEVAIRNSKKQVVTSEFADEDPEEELLSLVVDIISSQSMLQNEAIPRSSIIKLLISLMGIRTKSKMAKECFLTVCQQISINVVLSDVQLLLENLITTDNFVKTAILQGLDSQFDLTEEMSYSSEIWISSYDNDHNVAELAKTIWSDNEFALVSNAPDLLMNYISSEDAGMRLTVAKAIVASVEVLQEEQSGIFESTLQKLLDLFCEKQKPPPPELDKFGLAINKHALEKDQWEARSTIALALKFMSPLCSSQESVTKIFEFLVASEALGDKNELVAQELLEAGIEIITLHGLVHVESLVPIFEKCLAQADTGSKRQDRLRESVIILYGSLGRHLKADDERLHLIVERLLQTLDTPSEDVQYAVSECIAPLSQAFEPNLQAHFDNLFAKLWSGSSLAVRKGAAYGISGLVKGAGIRLIYAFDVMREISTAADDKKPELREGVAFVLDCLLQSLGAYFEPYVIETLPLVLKSLGDASPGVREATDMAARQIMKSTTSYGVKKLIPVAISHLAEHAWRSKKGAVELLGSMAYLDPAQLSASLSTIVPEIVGVLGDSHKEVRRAADQALKRFGEVIRNPEIQAIVPDLIRAIGDPANHTDTALEKLIRTQFVHYIDGPLLALIIHVIHRGMRDRSAATKKKACQIVGNMAILVDARDLLPYLAALVAELEVAMVDPVPATRSTGARALGLLVEKLGEDQFPDLIPRLLATLRDPARAGDRLGSAQALAEVICGLGLAKLDEMLPIILDAAQSPESHVRAGFMPMLLFLPVCFGLQFAPYLSRIVPPVLAGLADLDEDIRSTALRAGRLIVKNYASRAVDLLLPELERGLADLSPRIRLSSLELTGDLLFQVTGVSGKNELSEEQVEVGRALVDVLGAERRDRVLAALFVCRADVSAPVRAAAIDIWKALVANTPRAVKEIVPSLTHAIIDRLAGGDAVLRQIAAATLGDVVRRVGSLALARFLPTLEDALSSGDAPARLGICIALSELVAAASEEAVLAHQDTFIGIVQKALVDDNAEVRAAAAQAFEALQEKLGKTVVDSVVPGLLAQASSNPLALLALEELVLARAELFGTLLALLLAPPLDAPKAQALALLAEAAGSAVYLRLGSIVGALVQAISSSNDKESKDGSVEVLETSLDRILLCADDSGVHAVMLQLMHFARHEDSNKRAVAGERMAVFFGQTSLDYSSYIPDLVSQLVLGLGDADDRVVRANAAALLSLVRAQDKPQLARMVRPAHDALNLAGVRDEPLRAFVLGGPACIVPVFAHGLMYGTGDQRELSAHAIAQIITRTPPEKLRPLATTLAGPLIRVIGERVPPGAKTAILGALAALLEKIPQFLRPFVPQLQRTFVRSLSDAGNSELRAGAVSALGVLVAFQPRVDLLVTELVTSAKTAEPPIRQTMVQAMLQVVARGGAHMSEQSKAAVMGLVEGELGSLEDGAPAVAYARLLGAVARVLSPEEAAALVRDKILKDGASPFSVLAINSFLREAPSHIFDTGVLGDVVDFVVAACASPQPYISDNAVVALGKLLLLDGKERDDNSSGASFMLGDHLRTLVCELARCAVQPASNSPDTRRLALVVVRTAARHRYEALKPHWDVLVPAVFSCLRDAIIPIRLAAEKAYLALFNLVDDVDMKDFTEWFALVGEIKNAVGTVFQPRSIGDYTKRVAGRLAGVEREKISAGGDAEAMFSDRYEDEKEIWAVGGC